MANTTAHDTRARLLDAAEDLFAHRGIDGTPIQEITRLAGQRNSSALHYHFGSRAGLLEAVMARHLNAIDAMRGRMVDDLAAQGRTQDLTALVRALVLPLGSRLSNPAGRNYVLILQQTVGSVGYQPPPLGAPDSLRRLFGWLAGAIGELPKAVAAERLRFAVTAMVGAMAARIAYIDKPDGSDLGNEEFLEDLIRMLCAALAAPAGTAVRPPARSRRR